MNVLFLTLSNRIDVTQRGIYAELMKKFINDNHNVYIVYPIEDNCALSTTLKVENGANYLHVRLLDVRINSLIDKGLRQLSIEYLFKKAIRKYFAGIKFDLILYCTPPITFNNVVKYERKQNPQALTYLLLKDIFPQNAVDLGMMKKRGVKSFIYKYFRKKEIALYKSSDFIGCMSPANVEYIVKHNPYLNPQTVELAPNSVELQPERRSLSDDERAVILGKYNIPSDKPIFLYGGNFGKPQGIPFLIKCLNANKDRKDCHFLMVGNGTEFGKLEAWYKENKPESVTLLSAIPKNDYDLLASVCQVGLIFLDYRFTIPNYPSRLLPYLESKMPIIACTDPNCDTGTIAEANGYGFWCPSNDVSAFTNAVDKMVASDIKEMGKKGYEFLKNNYLIENTYDQIVKHIK